jgi:hypothetical protein
MFLLRSWAKSGPAEFVKSLWARPRDAVSSTEKCKIGLVLTNIYCPVFRGDCLPRAPGRWDQTIALGGTACLVLAKSRLDASARR